MIPLTNSKDCETYLRNIWEYDSINYEERIYIVFLDSKGIRIGFKMVDKGRYSQCDILPKKLLKIVRKAMKLKSKFLVLAHNHPCGDTTPSDNDIITTDKLALALSFYELSLVDHIIVTNDSYFSFKDAGMLSSSDLQKVG